MLFIIRMDLNYDNLDNNPEKLVEEGPHTLSSPRSTSSSPPGCSSGFLASGISIHVPVRHCYSIDFPVNITSTQPSLGKVLHQLKGVVLLENVAEDIHMVRGANDFPHTTQLKI